MNEAAKPSRREREEALIAAADVYEFCAGTQKHGSFRCGCPNGMQLLRSMCNALQAAHRREDRIRAWAETAVVPWQREAIFAILDGDEEKA